jgi:yecA family protein
LNALAIKHSMNLEQLDGFFAALTSGPQIVPPSDYLPVICGDEMVLQDTVNAQPVLQDFLSLMMRHWNTIADTLHSGEVFLPLLLQDENGITPANDWAIGFLRGMEFHKEEWAALFADENHGGWLVPIFALAHEHDPDPEMRPRARRALQRGVGAAHARAAGLMTAFQCAAAAELDKRKVETPRGGAWHPQLVKRIVQRLEVAELARETVSIQNSFFGWASLSIWQGNWGPIIPSGSFLLGRLS